jgi:hypothetical protein
LQREYNKKRERGKKKKRENGLARSHEAVSEEMTLQLTAERLDIFGVAQGVRKAVPEGRGGIFEGSSARPLLADTSSESWDG